MQSLKNQHGLVPAKKAPGSAGQVEEGMASFADAGLDVLVVR